MLSAVWLLPAILSLLGRRAVCRRRCSSPRPAPHRKPAAPGTPSCHRHRRHVARSASGRDRQLHGRSARPLGVGVVGGRALALIGLRSRGFYKLTREPVTSASRGTRRAAAGRTTGASCRSPLIPALLSLGLVLVLAIPALSPAPGLPGRLGHARGQHQPHRLRPHRRGLRPRCQRPAVRRRRAAPEGRRRRASARSSARCRAPRVSRRTVPNQRCCRSGRPAADQTVTAIQVKPTTGPAGRRDRRLLDRLREQTLPPVTERPASVAYIGGFTAIVADFSTVLTRRDAAVPQRGRRPRLPHAAGAVPLGRGLRDRRRDEPALLRRLHRHHGRGLPVGLAQRPARGHGHGPDLPVPPGDGVLDPVRPRDGLPGLPREPHAGGVGAARTTTRSPCAEGSPAPAASC